jgi:hypothetical protein
MAKRKIQKVKQRSTKHTYKTKDRATRTPLKTGVELMCSGRVSSSCSTIDTRRVNLVTNPEISHERGTDLEVLVYEEFANKKIVDPHLHKNCLFCKEHECLFQHNRYGIFM